MAGNKHGDEHDVRLPDLERPNVHHEESDVNSWAVGKFAIALVLICVASLAMLFGLFKFFEDREGGQLPRAATTVTHDASKMPPQPRLQDTPILDMQEMRAAEDQILNGYGWIDQPAGTVRIPINRAMDLLAQRGLPSRPQTEPQSASSNVSVPTESGLGPKMQQPGGPLAPELNAPRENGAKGTEVPKQ